MRHMIKMGVCCDTEGNDNTQNTRIIFYNTCLLQVDKVLEVSILSSLGSVIAVADCHTGSTITSDSSDGCTDGHNQPIINALQVRLQQ